MAENSGNSSSNRLETSPTPAPSGANNNRRYIQWGEDDIALLLGDLELPNHYMKWKENKSGYSKRVGEEVFKNAMNHETIKFKVRWLESRFKHWHKELTAPGIEQDEAAKNVIRSKMMKEFPYYERCKSIFDYTQQQQQQQQSDNESTSTPSPTTTTVDVNIHHKKRKQDDLYQGAARYLMDSSTEYSEGHDLKLKKIDLEYKRMDHEERMQVMRLEQLRLEIELEKLKQRNHTLEHI